MCKKTYTWLLMSLLLLSFFHQPDIAARPIYGRKNNPVPAERGTILTIPGAYTGIPEGRTGKTIGLAVVPKLPDNPSERDDAEVAIHEVMGHIPGLGMTITLPKNDSLYLFKILKQIKASGRKVDLVFIGGHAVQLAEADDVIGINMGRNSMLTPASLDVIGMQQEIEKLAQDGSNPARKKELCDKLKLIREGSSALVPGAQLIVHSCYLGSSNEKAFLKILGSSVLGVNGGTAIGPKNPIGSQILGGNNNPSGFWDTVSATLMTRSIQICQTLKSGKYLRPGDAVISTNFFTYATIQKGAIKADCPCDESADAGKSIPKYQRTAPVVQEKIWPDSYSKVQYQATDNSISWTKTNKEGSFVLRLDYSPPPPGVSGGKPFDITSSISGDLAEMNPHISWSTGPGFDTRGKPELNLDQGETSGSMALDTPVLPSKSQREGMWIKLHCGAGANNVERTWWYQPIVPVTSMMNKVSSAGAVPSQPAAPVSTRPVAAAVTKGVNKAPSGDYLFKRTGPFIKQSKLMDFVECTATTTEDSVTWSGKDITKTKQGSCTLKFTPPPETLSIGDSFDLSASLSGDEEFSPFASFHVGDDWIKSPSGSTTKLVSLKKDNCVPSNSSLCRVVDIKSTIAEFKKKMPQRAAEIDAVLKNKLPAVKLTCTGLVKVEMEWRYVRK